MRRVAYSLSGEFPAESQFSDATGWADVAAGPIEAIQVDEKTIHRLGLRNAFQTPIAIEQPSLQRVELIATCKWLTEHVVPDLGEWHTQLPPFVFRLADGSWLAERTFWSVVADVVDDAIELVTAYVRAIIARCRGSLAQMSDRQETIPGEDALYAFADRRIHSANQLSQGLAPSDVDPFLDVFTDFMALNDLGHAVRQYDEMMRVVETLQFQLQRRPELIERYVRLAAVFEHNDLDEEHGARNSANYRKRLLAPRAFKLLLTQLLGRDFEPEYLPLPVKPGSIDEYKGAATCCVAELILLVYGDDPAQEDVFRWVQARTGLDVRPNPDEYHEWERREIERNLAELAVHRPRCQDNGFHRFDFQADRWVPLADPS